MNMNLNMDTFVNKLRNTVSQVAYSVNSSVNTVMPGNLIQREYNTIKKRCSHGCPGFYWDIYDAIKSESNILANPLSGSIGPIVNQFNRDSNTSVIGNSNETRDRSTNQRVELSKQLYSVFIFEKRQLDRLNKMEKDLVIDHLKRSVTQLTRIRHPSILTVHHSLEESRSTLAFVTEHIFGSLDVIFKTQKEQESQSSNSNRKAIGSLVELDNSTHNQSQNDASKLDDNCFLDIVQIKSGLLQVCDGLKFLHHDAKMMHRNLCFENIFINSNNVWKIGGFDFSCTADQIEISDKGGLPYCSLRDCHKTLPTCITPNWSCSAPEHSSSSTVTFSADIYSLGVISCAAFNWDIMNIDLSYEAGLVSDTYKRGLMIREIVDRLPMKIKSDLQKFTTINIATRPSLDDFQKLSIFDDVQVQTLRFLDVNFTWDNFKKTQFYTGLKGILPQLSHQVKLNRVATALIKEFMNPDMLPHVLPNYLLIVQESNPVEFEAKLLPHMKNLFGTMEPASIPIMLLENLPMMTNLSKNCRPLFEELALPLIYRSLQSSNCQLNEQCLAILPLVKPLLDTGCLQNNLLPILHRLCIGTSILAVRVKCLVCIGKLVDVIDSWLIIEKVLPILRELPSKEPAVIMSTVGIIKLIHANSKMTKETIATSIIPIIFPLCIEKELNLQQFQNIMVLIKELVSKVEKDQTETLKKLTRSEDSNKYSPMVLNHSSSGTSPSLNQLSEGATNHIKSLAILD